MHRAVAFNAGHFHKPTALVDVTDDMRVLAEENLGPIAAISSFSTDDEALARANATDMGLAAYAFTANPSRARRTVAELRAGIVGIISRADGGVQLRVAVSFVQNVLDFPTDRIDTSLVVNGAEAHLA